MHAVHRAVSHCSEVLSYLVVSLVIKGHDFSRSFGEKAKNVLFRLSENIVDRTGAEKKWKLFLLFSDFYRWLNEDKRFFEKVQKQGDKIQREKRDFSVKSLQTEKTKYTGCPKKWLNFY